MYDFMYEMPIPPWALVVVLFVLIGAAIFCIFKYKDDSHARNLCIFSILACVVVLVMQVCKNCA